MCHFGVCGRPHRFEDFPAGENDCDDGEGCTTDVCLFNSDPSTTRRGIPSFDNLGDFHCVNLQNDDGTFCEDGDLCTVYDQCAWGMCQVGSVKDCSLRSGYPFVYRDRNGSRQYGTYGGERDYSALPDPVQPNYELALARYLLYNGAPGTEGFSAECFTNTCDPGDGVCVFEFVEDGAACGPGYQAGVDEESAECSVFECSTGRCVVSDDCASGNECTLGVCGYDRQCRNVAVVDQCDDGLFCTGQLGVEEDTCLNGVCVGTAVTCPVLSGDRVFLEELADGTVVTNRRLSYSTGTFSCDGYSQCGLFGSGCFNVTCSEEERGACVYSRRENGTSCVPDGDGGSGEINLCSAYQCMDGACTEEEIVDCSIFEDECRTAVCVPATGECELVPVRGKGIVCETGDLCSEGECFYGDCVATPRNCSAFDGPCEAGACNPGTGACTTVPANVGEACETGSLCADGSCSASGTCVGVGRNCTFLDTDCKSGVCDEGTGKCIAAEVGEVCGTGDLCVIGACSSGVCVGESRDCSVLDAACTEGVCDSATGGCMRLNVPDGGACASGGGLCAPGSCRGGLCIAEPTNCTGLTTECSAGVCDVLTGMCVAEAREGACSTGNRCLSGQCAEGVCVGEAVNCTVLDSECTVGSCNGATGECFAVPVRENRACESGDACAPGTCQSGGCTGSPADCSAFSSVCTVGACEEGLCRAEARGDVGDCFGGQNLCVPGVCTGSLCVPAPVNCTSFDTQCGVGICNATTGGCSVVAQPGVVCDDGNAATVNDTCLVSGLCVGVVPGGAGGSLTGGATDVGAGSGFGGVGGGNTGAVVSGVLGGFAVAAVLGVMLGRRGRWEHDEDPEGDGAASAADE